MKYINKIIYILIFYFIFHKFKNVDIKNRILSNEIYIDSYLYLKSLKKVVYTVLLGKYDNIHPIIKEKDYDYFMFTDQLLDTKTNNNWTIMKLEPKIIFSEISDRRKRIKTQRYYKTHPHLFFKNYDLSIYIDATYEIRGKLDDFLLRILTPNKSIYILEHPERNNIYNESNAIVLLLKDFQKNTIPIIKRYKKEKFPDDNGLAETCLIVRKHKDFKCINFMEKLFQEIKSNSHRDQLSFNYIFWKLGNKIVKYIPKNYALKYFIQHEYHLINYTFQS